MVSHSHDDVGWINTPEEYYEIKVRTIITSVINSLLENESRRFSQAEIYYFEKWWKEQTESMRESVRMLVREGRLEFVNGGWVASDEACPTYEEILQNLMLGHSFLY